MNQGVDGIIDDKTFEELLTFIYNKKGKAEADEGNLDDRVMCQAIKLQLHKWPPAPERVKVLPRDPWEGTDYKEHEVRNVIPRPKEVY